MKKLFDPEGRRGKAMEKQKRRPYLMTWVTALAIVVVALAAAMVIRGVMAADDGTDIGSEKAKSI